MLAKSRALNVDTVAYDLEDSVTPDSKPMARRNLREFLSQPRVPGIREQAVRINSVSSGLALDDLMEVLPSPHLDAIVVPKVNSASDLHFITDVLKHTLPNRHPSSPQPLNEAPDKETTTPPLRIIALIESAQAITSLASICASTPYLSGLIFAAEDFALDLSLTRTPSLREFLYARSAMVTHARAFGIPSAIDLVCTSFRGADGQRALEEECLDGRGMGFNGKQVIHPDQVECAQRVFGVGEEEATWAVRVAIGGEKADAKGRGAWSLDGKMIDAPVVGKAKAILQRAELCGIDVGALREKWKDQEPQ